VGGVSVAGTNARLAYVDALRGWAILGVFLVHSEALPLFPTSAQFVADQAGHGVQLFFVVSAFTLTVSLARAPELRAFFVRRLARIGPMFWLGIALYSVTWGFGPRYWAPTGIQPADVVLTAAFAHGWGVNTFNSVVPGGWSIAVEAMFYLLLPLLLLVLTTWRRAVIALGVSVIVATVAEYVARRGLPAGYMTDGYISCWLPAQIPVFITGIAIAKARPVPRLLSLPLLLAGIGALAVAQLPYQYGLGFGLLTLGFGAVPWRLLINPVTRTLGIISFSMYVWHFEVLRRVAELNVTPWYVAALLSLAITVGLAAVSYVAIERPGLSIGKWVAERVTRSGDDQRSDPLPAAVG
jgi:peptidoglycan/LPS O-acetylase OafA/YrhL